HPGRFLGPGPHEGRDMTFGHLGTGCEHVFDNSSLSCCDARSVIAVMILGFREVARSRQQRQNTDGMSTSRRS
ncbi:hypothetical protein, partial [Pseudonocardia sp. NPDC049154]|uniref:hypothetical protein n=1 Tax=Pseudonocardia sp. NPDC049154 TaxID=3155501 RepID=UPI003411B352